MFLVAGGRVARPAAARRFYWRALGWFFGGIVANAVYGVVQLLVAQAGGNLDSLLLSPLTGGASRSTSTAP